MLKRLTSILIIFSVICSLNITVSAGGYSYFEFSFENGEATLIYFDEQSYVQGEKTTIVYVPSTYTYDGVIYPVTRIGERVFQACNKITSVVLTDSTKYISGAAFDCCYSLKSISIPDSVVYIGEYAFEECSSLETVKLSENITEINNNVFAGCSSLKEVTIPDTVTTIGEAAFQRCGSLEIVNFGSGVKIISKQAFNNCQALNNVHIPSSCEFIGEQAFAYNAGLSLVTFDEGLKTLGREAFSETSLTQVALPDSLESIGFSAFGYCSELSEINMPANLKSIDDYAFYWCNLQQVHIYDKLESIGSRAFSKNAELNSITVEAGNAFFSSHEGNLLNKEQTSFIQYAIGNAAKDYTLPSTVTTIEAYAFERARTLKQLTLSDNLKIIGEGAFLQCGVRQLYIPASVTSIGENCFAGASLTAVNVAEDNSEYSSDEGVLYNKNKSLFIYYPGRKTDETYVVPTGVKKIADTAIGNNNLKTLIISEGVTEIGVQAISGCSSLVDIKLPSTLNTIGAAAFSETAIESIIIPEGVETFEQAFIGCNNLKSVVLPVSLTLIGRYTFYDELADVVIYYRGSSQQWSSITVDEENDGLESCTVICDFTESNPVAPVIRGCELVGDLVNIDIDYTHNVSGSTAFVGIYDGNRLVKVEKYYVSAGANQSTLSVAADSSYVGKTVKILYWDAPESMNNMCGGVSAVIELNL